MIKNPRKAHKKTIIEYIVYRTSKNGSVWYYAGDNESGGPLWVERRTDAKTFDDVASANTVAERESGEGGEAMNFWIIQIKLKGTDLVRYLTENGTWTDVRSEARTFYDITSASRVADKYGGEVVHR